MNKKLEQVLTCSWEWAWAFFCFRASSWLTARGTLTKKKTGSCLNQEPANSLVETGEGQSPSYRIISILLEQRRALGIRFRR